MEFTGVFSATDRHDKSGRPAVTWFGPATGSTSTDMFGNFAVAGLAPGSYHVFPSMLVQAFLAPVDLLVLDEPLSGLDAAARDTVHELIAERRSGGASVLVSSHVALGENPPDLTLELRQGRLFDVVKTNPLVHIELCRTTDGAQTAWPEISPARR